MISCVGELDERHRLVASLVESGAVRTAAVREALLAVPRDAFTPKAFQHQAYVDRPVPLRADAAGELVSSISQPSMVARMLEQLKVRNGDRVLEIGTASGYNAALLGHLARPTGSVVTMEIDEELADEALSRLSRGWHNVRVITGDGHVGYPKGAPYDRVIVTAGAAAVAPAWTDQLRDGGRLVVPLTNPSHVGECVTFVKEGGSLERVHSTPCGFVPMRGRAGD